MEDFVVILLVSRCLKHLVSYEVSHSEYWLLLRSALLFLVLSLKLEAAACSDVIFPTTARSHTPKSAF